ncbi:MAG: hypothetical protein OXJ37_12095 [Bryobacterales bacterium]|nr:hypothetical protein [Bryobacterales bacterium]
MVASDRLASSVDFGDPLEKRNLIDDRMHADGLARLKRETSAVPDEMPFDLQLRMDGAA